MMKVCAEREIEPLSLNLMSEGGSSSICEGRGSVPRKQVNLITSSLLKYSTHMHFLNVSSLECLQDSARDFLMDGCDRP